MLVPAKVVSVELAIKDALSEAGIIAVLDVSTGTPGVTFTQAVPLYCSVCEATGLVIVAEKFPPPDGQLVMQCAGVRQNTVATTPAE
jgi:hypothetical protein